MAFEMILVAYALGFVASRVGLPPLVGYLIAGFVLHEVGHPTGDGVDAIADLGVLLLLFGIGLKLRPATLAKPVVWATTAAHTIVASLLIGGALLVAGAIALPLSPRPSHRRHPRRAGRVRRRIPRPHGGRAGVLVGPGRRGRDRDAPSDLW